MHERRDSSVGALNFFNKVICELLTVDVKIDEEDKALIILSSLLESYDILSPPCSMVRKLSFWRRSRQLSYLIRLGKCQIKRNRQDRVWKRKEEKEEKARAHQRCVIFVTGKVIKRMTTNIDKSD